jgi:peptide/nickel transport system substrate-binding protein
VLAADALCTRDQLGCDVSRPPAPYDPAAAKRLLAEAGYPDGFDVEITALQGTFALADAVSGEFRKIGIRATVDKATFGTFRQKQAEGKNALVTQWWPTLSSLDASQLVSYLFDATPRNYTRDDTIAGLAEKGLATVDQTARKAIYRQLFDRVNELSFLIPIASFPDVVAHFEGSPDRFRANTRHRAPIHRFALELAKLGKASRQAVIPGRLIGRREMGIGRARVRDEEYPRGAE